MTAFFSLQRFASKRREPLKIPSEKPVPGFLLGRLSAGALRHGRKIEKYCRCNIFHSRGLRRSAANLCRSHRRNPFRAFSSGVSAQERFDMVGRLKNISDAIFFTQELVPRDGPGSFNPIGEIAFANFSSGAAPASGIIRKIKKVKIFCLTNTGCIVTIAQVWKKS